MALKCSKESLLEHSKDLNKLKLARAKMIVGTSFYKEIAKIIAKHERENDKIRTCLGLTPIYKKKKKK